MKPVKNCSTIKVYRGKQLKFDFDISSEFEDRIKKFCEDADADLASFSYKRADSFSTFKSSQASLEAYRNEAQYYKQKYEDISNASFWKMTAPFRQAVDFYRYVKTGQKKERRREPRQLKTVGLQSRKPRIGVHLHLYYEDILEEICGYLNNIPENFDLYISCKKNLNKKWALQLVQKIENVHQIVIKESENRGRDIAPFYVLFRKELQQYPILLHVHSKKSLYTGKEKSEWRHWALDGVLKDRNSVSRTLAYLSDSSSKAGLVFGEMNPSLPLFALHWLKNISRGSELLGRMGIPFENTMFFYPVGSFFWAKREAIQPLFDLKLSYGDFEEEKGQIDGTMAHALERVIAKVVRNRGYNLYIFNQCKGTFSLNKSYYVFSNYFSLNVSKVIEELKQYDVISFDIFDTLITRMVYQPDDIFRFMGRILEDQYGISVNYLKIRKDAEALARKQHGDFFNIHHIYQKIPQVSSFSEEDSQKLKQMEIDLEFKVCIPRRDVVEIYQALKKSGKKLILVSDMYLTSDIISTLLEKCGISDFDELWVSCEKGKRKDNDTIWDDFFARYGELRTIHIGDNPHSDGQLISDRGRSYLLLLSSAEQFRLSRQYDMYRPYLDGPIENSLILGYMVNRYLYNSPFGLTANGGPCIETIDELSKGVYGPLFLLFCEYIHKTSHKNTILLFLAREGYFFQKLYKKYCSVFQYMEKSNFYFLASRRAASVAQIDTYNDARELLNTNFSGTVAALFKERFGLIISASEGNRIISLPKDIPEVINILKNHARELLENAAAEKKHYLKYIYQELGKDIEWENVTVVDLGYAGSIQYYLMKLVGAQMDGCYLIMDYQMKPEKLHGTFRGLYSFWSSRRFDENKLFLEAVAAAPHGQVVRFEDQKGKETAVLKPESECYGKDALIFQKPVYQYIEDMGLLLKNINFYIDKNLVECIFSEMLQEKALAPAILHLFSVEDGYCAGGEWFFDEEKNKWIIKTDI